MVRPGAFENDAAFVVRISFASAGVADQNVVSYLILDANGGWETGWGTYGASGTTLTRNVSKSSNSNAPISLSGNAQVFITARAEDIATVHVISSGRFELGVGIGFKREEFEGFGVSSKERGKRTDQSLEILRRALAGETVTFKSEFFDF